MSAWDKIKNTGRRLRALAISGLGLVGLSSCDDDARARAEEQRNLAFKRLYEENYNEDGAHKGVKEWRGLGHYVEKEVDGPTTSGPFAGQTGCAIPDTAGPNSVPYEGEKPLVQADSSKVVSVDDLPATREGPVSDRVIKQSDSKAGNQETVSKTSQTLSKASKGKLSSGGARPLAPTQKPRQIERKKKPIEPEPKMPTSSAYNVDMSRFIDQGR